MWTTSIALSELVLVVTEVHPRPLYLVRAPGLPLESEQPTPTLRSSPIATRRSLTSLPGVWVPPIVFRTPEGERPFGYTQSGLQALWSEIMGTLLVSPEPK